MLRSFSAAAAPPPPPLNHMISVVIPCFLLFFFLNKINGIMPKRLINDAKTHNFFPAEVIFHNTWSQNLSGINHVCVFGMSWGQSIQNLKASSVTVHLLLQKWFSFFFSFVLIQLCPHLHWLPCPVGGSYQESLVAPNQEPVTSQTS